MKVSEKIVDAILEDISDRAGLGDEWGTIHPSIKKEIKETWAKIIENELKNAHWNGEIGSLSKG